MDRQLRSGGERVNGIIITPLSSLRRYRGRRARRAAFYNRARTAKAVQRLARHISLAFDAGAIMQAYEDAIVTGMGAVQIERIEPRPDLGAFPYRVRSLTRAEFEGEFYGSPLWRPESGSTFPPVE